MEEPLALIAPLAHFKQMGGVPATLYRLTRERQFLISMEGRCDPERSLVSHLLSLQAYRLSSVASRPVPVEGALLPFRLVTRIFSDTGVVKCRDNRREVQYVY
jgi:hypothetical protein